MAEWAEPLKIRAARPDDAKEIARIYNQGVQDRVATFENSFVSPEERYLWLVARPEKYPVLVAEVKHTMMGWASLSPYSPRACYNGIAELSIYIDRSLRGHGVGQELMKAMQQAACDKGYTKLVGRIMEANEPGRKLCGATGWREVGVHRRHAKLGDEWHDLVLVEYLIPENQK
jgi:L-amino acid N-acyltransferase YncA